MQLIHDNAFTTRATWSTETTMLCTHHRYTHTLLTQKNNIHLVGSYLHETPLHFCLLRSTLLHVVAVFLVLLVDERTDSQVVLVSLVAV
jgi:hypothetical protein